MRKDRALILPANATLWDAYNKGVSDTIDKILADLKTVIEYAEVPHLDQSLTFSYWDYRELINELYKKYEAE